MKRLAILLLLLGLTGCLPVTKPESSRSPATEEPVTQAPPAAPPPPTPVDPTPRVEAIVITGPSGQVRYTADSQDKTLRLAGPLQLRAEVTHESPKGSINWFFEGLLNPEPGLIPKDAAKLISLGNNREIEWNPGPGTDGRLWVEAWGEHVRDGQPGWRSWALYARYPFAETTQCPAVMLPRASGENVADYGQTMVDDDMNRLIMDRMGQRFLIPLSADPASCIDELLAARLRMARGR